MTRHSHYYHRRPTNNQRSLNEYESLPQTPSPYPGITPYTDYPEVGETALYPYTDGVTDMEASASALAPSTNSGGSGLAGLLGGGGGSGGGGGLGKLLGGLGVNNMSDIKGLIDRMGASTASSTTLARYKRSCRASSSLRLWFLCLQALSARRKAEAAADPLKRIYGPE